MARPRSKEEAKAIAIARSRARKGQGGLIVTGDKEIDKLLAKVEKKLAKKVVRKAMREANRKTLADAKANAPEDEGDLKEMIKLRAIRRSRRGFGVLVRIESKDFPGQPFYPIVQEYGSEKMNIPAVAYMRRAYEANKERVRAEVIAAVKAGLDALIRSEAKT